MTQRQAHFLAIKLDLARSHGDIRTHLTGTRAVGVLKLNQPKMLNALSFGVFKEIGQAIDVLKPTTQSRQRRYRRCARCGRR